MNQQESILFLKDFFYQVVIMNQQESILFLEIIMNLLGYNEPVESTFWEETLREYLE